MKHLKVTSVLLSVAMCMTMAVTPVMADETAPEQPQTTEETQEKETEEQEAAPSNEDDKEPESVKGQIPEEKAQTEAEDAYLAKGKCGKKVKWTLDKKGTLKITGKGAMNNYRILTGYSDGSSVPVYFSNTPWDKNRSKIKKVVVSKGITAIGEFAFTFCENMTSVSLPKTLKSIRTGAFNYCHKLKKVSIPKSVKTIGAGAFDSCGFESVVIPNGITSISNYTFDGCKNLKSVTIPSSVKSLGSNAFSNCDSLTTVKIPFAGLLSIGYEAFSGCKSLTEFVVPITANGFGDYCFAGCTSLSKFGVNAKQKGLFPSHAFYKSGEFTYEVNTYAMSGDEFDVGPITYKVSNPAINGTGAVHVFSIGKDEENVVIPATVEHTDESGKTVKYKVTGIVGTLYEYNTSKKLKTLVIGSNVSFINDNALLGCPELESVTGGKGLKTIGAKVFANCPKLKVFNISSKTLKKIGANAFEGDTALTTLFIRNTTKLTKAGVKGSLKGSSVKTVKVKKSKVKKYKKFFKTGNCGKKVTVKK